MASTTIHDRYILEEQIGEGGMGEVYRAQDLLLKRPVAVKVLSKTPQAAHRGEAWKARLLSEAQAAARLNHPNIVTVYDAGTSGDVPFIVMELLEGENLRQYGPHSLGEVLELVVQVCAALEHAHQAGIIHRDLKLENVIRTPTGRVKLMDFGLARTSGSPRLTESGALVGTVLYMAPELLMGQPAGAQSDLYALGVMFYELACGRPPFTGEDSLALISQHLHGTPVPPSTLNPAIPVAVETLILRLLAKQPADRPASAAVVLAALDQAGAHEESSAPAGSSLDRVVRGRLVGRERELGEARAAFLRAQKGEGGILLVSGEPGVGKSRLARELAVQVQLAQGLPLVGECYAEGGAPYAAFAQMILNAPAWPEGLPALVVADLISLAPALRVRFPDAALNPPLEPQVEQQRLYESAFTFFAALAGRAPLLLVLEDAHWADGGSLALARSLARRFRQAGTPALVVLTFREAEVSENKGLADLLAAWNHERAAQTLKLHRLDRRGTQDLLEALFAEPVTEEFAGGIYHETEGNPFFIEELCKALIESGQVFRENGSWQRRSAGPMELPRSIRMAIEARLEGLPPAAQDVLRMAAVLGRRFSFDVLQAADPGRDEDTLITALEAAEQAQLLNEVGRGGEAFEFVHALIPTTLVETLSGMRRRRLHRRAIAALEQLQPKDYKTLAYHCLEASEDERALGYLVKAAGSARAAFANAEAVANYQRALGVLDDLMHEAGQEEDLRSLALKIYEDLGEVLELTGQHGESLKAYRQALAVLPPAENIARARLLRLSGITLQNQRRYDDAGLLYEQAEAALGEMPAQAQDGDQAAMRAEWVDLQLNRLLLDYWRGNVAQMEALVDRVRPAVEQYGSPDQRALFFSHLASMMLRRDRYAVTAEMLEIAAEGVKASLEGARATTHSWARFLLGFTLVWHGDLDRAESELHTVLELVSQTGDAVIRTRALTYLTLVHRKRCAVEQALDFAARSLEAAAASQMLEYTSMARANLCWARRRMGHFEEALQLGVSAWEDMSKTTQGHMFNWVAAWPLLGLQLDQGKVEQAVEMARILLAPTTQPQPEPQGGLLRQAVEAWEAGRAGEAAGCLARAAELAARLGYL